MHVLGGKSRKSEFCGVLNVQHTTHHQISEISFFVSDGMTNMLLIVNSKAKSTTFLFFLNGVIYCSDLSVVMRSIFKSITFVVRVVSLVRFNVAGKYDSQKVCILWICFFARKVIFSTRLWKDFITHINGVY